MTLSASLTWLHLFPSNAVFNYGDAPAEWVEALGRRVTSRRPGAVYVACGRPMDRWPSLGASTGLVAINCPGVNPQTLWDQGFEYVRHFAIVPSLRQPRWFIPLGIPAVAAAGFGLFTPARWTAQLKRVAVRVATYTRCSWWYQDDLWIALRATPPLPAMLSSLLAEPELRLALSSGAPEPARNRKASVAVISPRGRMLAYAKLASSAIARPLLAHEAQVLAALANDPGTAALAPRLLFAGEVDGTFTMVQSALSGRPAGGRLTPAHHQFLVRLQSADKKPAASTALVDTVRRRIDRLAEMESANGAGVQVRAALVELLPQLQRIIVPTTIMHGDFAPWNLLESGGSLVAFDWEYAELDGLPLLDLCHHMLQVGYQLSHWSPARAADELLQVHAASGFDLDAVRVLTRFYLIEVLSRMLAEGYAADHDIVAWKLAVLQHLAPAKEELLV